MTSRPRTVLSRPFGSVKIGNQSQRLYLPSHSRYTRLGYNQDIMAASAIIISSDFRSMAETILSLTHWMCGLVPYTGFDSDAPDEMTFSQSTTLMLILVLVEELGFILRILRLVHSLGLDAPDQAHFGIFEEVVSPRLVLPPRRAHDRKGPTHSSPYSVGPSRKRCRSPIDSVPLSMPVTGSLAPTRADLSPPRKRFRDLYSSEASIEEDAEVGLTGTGVDMELGIDDGDEVGDHVGIDHRDARDDKRI
ncbi:hypothetical protein Tco_0971737 [Tanacetum coccineum]